MSVARESLEGAAAAAPAAARPSEPALLPELFADVARRFPEQVAVDIPPGAERPARVRVTYRELARQAFAVAAALRPALEAHGEGERVVALLLQRDTAALFAAQLGVMGAGGAYVCLDPSMPDERLRFIVGDAAPVRLVTDAGGLERARAIAGADAAAGFVVDVAESLAADTEEAGEGFPEVAWLGPESLAYIIYTSGTTGRPKGVMIEHRSVANLVDSDIELFGLGPDDRMAQGSSPAYDSSVEEIWLAFGVGACLVPMDDVTARLGPDLVTWLRNERITVLCPPPTLLRTTGCDDPAAALPALRLLYVGGEALTADIAERWGRGCWLENGYGPTECTVTVVRGRVTPGEPITIGQPVRGNRAWALGEGEGGALLPVADGEVGELHIGGVGLARGYLGRPELTAERFVEHPQLGRIYRTGDLVRREPSGDFSFLGRADTQVKLRGHRIELEEIEAQLTAQPGVLEAACRVQGRAGREFIAAWLVARDGARPTGGGVEAAVERIRAALARELPGYMVPARIGWTDRLPRTAGGKLARQELPEAPTAGGEGDSAAPARVVEAANATEAAVAEAVTSALDGGRVVSVTADFFDELGGDSLTAAVAISALRDHPETAQLTVRDLYETRTVRGLAARADGARRGAGPASDRVPPRSPRAPAAATAVQSLYLLAQLLVSSVALWAFGFVLLPPLMSGLGVVGALLVTPLVAGLALLVWAPLSVGMAVLAKRALIRRYRPGRERVYGGFYVRNWIVQQVVRLVPWGLFEGTEFQCVVLRLLGARIGRRVHIHRGVNLRQGGWDLLTIGDDVTLGQEAAVRLVDLDGGELVVGPVSLGDGASLDVRSGVAADTTVEAGGQLAPLSALSPGGRIPAGERFDGVPARPAGPARDIAPAPEGVRSLSPLRHGALTILAGAGLRALVPLPLALVGVGAVLAFDVDGAQALDWLYGADSSTAALLVLGAATVAAVPIRLATQALLMRAVGRVEPGVVPLRSLAYLRVWLKSGLLTAAGRWLAGSLWWPVWLRAAGMRLGRGCEISTIIDVVPELVSVGDESFFADGIYLGGPRIRGGRVELAETSLGGGTFLGNHVVVEPGQRLPGDILLGIKTVADDTRVEAGSSWFGHPAFRLPRREVVEMDRTLTHDPGFARYWTRVFWELLRFFLPLLPLVAGLLWFEWVAAAAVRVSPFVLVAAVIPAVTVAVGASLCLLLVALKWALLGRVRPGRHAFWSCWCGRWDLLYVAWGFWVRGLLAPLQGTTLLAWYLRAMGCRIGRRCVLGEGFAQVVDPDMIHIEDGATFNGLFQAHSFEDRVLKTDHVHIRAGATVSAGAVLLYGADIGEGARVTPHSVVMKMERLLPGRDHEGCPTTVGE